MNRTNTEKLYTLTEACGLLSISTATGRNWMKSGRLVSATPSDETPLFTESTLCSLKTDLTNGTLSGLKGRRNKSFIAGCRTYGGYIDKASKNQEAVQLLLAFLAQANLVITDTLLFCLLRHCAEQLLLQAGYPSTHLFEELLTDLISNADYSAFQNSYPSLSQISYTYDPSEDTLGFLYQSLCSLKDRKSSGAYYTPARLAKRLISDHLTMLEHTASVLDPSCGTGIFLLQLPASLPLNNLFGTDLNPISIALARLNLAIRHHITTREELLILKKNIVVSDFLNTAELPQPEESSSVDIILGNPPWGARLSTEAKKNYRKHFTCASGNSVEIYDLFLEQALRHLTPGGILSFILPEALLTVKSHRTVRQLLLKEVSVCSVEYLGEAFEQVHCPSIIFTVTKDNNRPFFKNVQIITGEHTFSTLVERTFSPDNFSFTTTDEEYLLLQKLLTHPNCTTLKNQAEFALGIVTGNNAELIKDTPSQGLEPIIRGSDISKYHINSHSGYLLFQPKQFQQTAPEQFYRAPEKLFYRFINTQLIFAYDNTGLLSLNSCNILIPHIDGLSMKYILAILNSGIAQFIFEKKFRSVKVLRSHLEQLPIPLADDETQEEMVSLVDLLMKYEKTSPEYKKTYTLLDRKVAELYELTAKEYKLISTECLSYN